MAVTLTTFPPARMTGAPGYLASRFYHVFGGVFAAAVAVPTVDTIIILNPFSPVDYPLIATSLNTRTATGAVGSAVKMAVWGNSPTTKRPTGVPLIGSNTGQATTGSSSTQSIAVSYVFLPGVTYWFGAAFTTLAPTMYTVATTDLSISKIVGRTAVTNAGTFGLSAPYAYATDIMALNLTAATFTDMTVGGAPLLIVGT